MAEPTWTVKHSIYILTILRSSYEDWHSIEEIQQQFQFMDGYEIGEESDAIHSLRYLSQERLIRVRFHDDIQEYRTMGHIPQDYVSKSSELYSLLDNNIQEYFIISSPLVSSESSSSSSDTQDSPDPPADPAPSSNVLLPHKSPGQTDLTDLFTAEK